MEHRKRLLVLRSGSLFAFLLWCSLLSACDSASEGASTGGRSVCPTCPAEVGGESSDFGGTPTACGAISERVEIDAEQVAALGYELVAIGERVEREIDAELVWTPESPGDAEPALGYEEHTRVEGRITLMPTYTHYRPDPRYCDATICNSEEHGVVDLELASCLDFLEIEATVELTTIDGAVNVVAHGTAWQWRSGSEGMVEEDPADEINVEAHANLLDVTGNLKLFPGDGEPVRAQYRDTDYSGVLAIDVSFEGDRMKGTLRPEIWLEVADKNGNTKSAIYAPLKGEWTSEP